MATKKNEDAAEVYAITTAPTSLSEDQSARARRYFISMMVRTVCFILAVVTSGPWRWIFLAGAVFLPYFAVIFANSGRERSRASGEHIDHDRRALH